MTTPSIDVLRPRVGRSLWHDTTETTASHSVTGRIARFYRLGRPEARYLFIGAFLLAALLFTTSSYGTLWLYKGTPLNIALAKHPTLSPTVRLPFALDVEGIAFVFAGLLTPIFCARQARLIPTLFEANEKNDRWRDAASVAPDELNRAVKKANDSFDFVSNWRTSLAIAGGSALITAAFYAMIAHYGPLAAWNPSHASSERWHELVYSGWWANPRRYPVSAALLFIIGTYFVYFLTKQLWMGLIFSRFARASARLRTAVVPDLEVNVDGHWGLRPLRRLLVASYVSSFIHFLSVVGMFWLWLPFTQWTLFIIAAVGLANILTVSYPSVIAHASVVDMKTEYIGRLIDDSDLVDHPSPTWPGADVETRVAAIWAIPGLPFKTKSTVAALSAYVIAPLVLAVLSALILPRA